MGFPVAASFVGYAADEIIEIEKVAGVGVDTKSASRLIGNLTHLIATPPQFLWIISKSMRRIFKFKDDLVQICTAATGLQTPQSAEPVIWFSNGWQNFLQRLPCRL